MLTNEDRALAQIADALAEIGRSVDLDECRQPSIGGIRESILRLGEDLRSKEASKIRLLRELQRAEWLHECAEKDVTKMKERMKDLQDTLSTMPKA